MHTGFSIFSKLFIKPTAMDTIPRPNPVTITINLPAKTLNFIRTWASRVRYAEGDREAITEHEAIVSEAVIDAIKTQDRFLLEEGDPTPSAEGPEYLIYILNGLTSKCFPVKVTEKTSNQDLATMIERHEERPCHESFALRDRKGKLIYGEKSSIFAGEARELLQVSAD